ncbi:IclR family transcriptional regulator [Methylophaga sp. OBS4]|uniref:IclR family transcriptional regulator n=1 Tax=Methylophaga sp. OBS4 TaxID=2991935 RepID=UPI0022519D49|nr:helix-turn-helix domain-containing protein [Methylophaga sp. OBS4]MCX4188254.1 helix-turn-helix domain-containing protein [Methylophaga sp. OBS4]
MKSSTGSLKRAEIILTAIASGPRRGTMLKELVQRTRLPRPTIYRVLQQLMALGWVVRDDEQKRFRLGMAITAMGYAAMAHNPIERIAANRLSQLADLLGQVVYINCRTGLDMVCMGRYESDSDIQVGKGYVSMRGPFGLSPGCFGMFACMPEQEVYDIIEANMHRYHKLEWFDETGFRESLAQTLVAGYGIFGNIMLDRSTRGLGAAICASDGYPLAGIGTTFINGWLSEEQEVFCVAELQQAARDISAEINWFEAQLGSHVHDGRLPK